MRDVEDGRCELVAVMTHLAAGRVEEVRVDNLSASCGRQVAVALDERGALVAVAGKLRRCRRCPVHQNDIEQVTTRVLPHHAKVIVQ